MVKIKITIENDEGYPLAKLKSLDLDLGKNKIYEIEREVEKIKKKMLPEITKQLLLKSQKEFTKEEKNRLDLTCNGSYDVKRKTIHGHFIFPLQRYEIKKETYNYFDLSHQLRARSFESRFKRISRVL